jgi:hypothetical protein
MPQHHFNTLALINDIFMTLANLIYITNILNNHLKKKKKTNETKVVGLNCLVRVATPCLP